MLPRITDQADDWVSTEAPRVLGDRGGAALEPVMVDLLDTQERVCFTKRTERLREPVLIGPQFAALRLT